MKYIFTTKTSRITKKYSHTHLENKKGSRGPLFEELQEIWHHHLSTIGTVVLFCSSEFSFLLVATPGLKVAHWVSYGKCYWKETFLLFVVKHVADLLKLKRQNLLPILILLVKTRDKNSNCSIHSLVLS